MLRFVTVAISIGGGLTDTTKQVIASEFLISPALVDVITSWVLSHEVDDEHLTDDQHSAAPPDSWLHHAQQLVPPDSWLHEARQSISGTQDEPNEPELPVYDPFFFTTLF